MERHHGQSGQTEKREAAGLGDHGGYKAKVVDKGSAAIGIGNRQRGDVATRARFDAEVRVVGVDSALCKKIGQNDGRSIVEGGVTV